MARHNREGVGTDQRGFDYSISYQPDSLRQVKVTRLLPNGRQSTMTLFRNPAGRSEAPPGEQVRTRITCQAQNLDVEVAFRGAGREVRQLQVQVGVPGNGRHGSGEDLVVFTLDHDLPEPLSHRSVSQ
ncbi:MAG: hypothetical protein WEA09_09125 [Gemmatimonadota bacterium]